MNFDHHYFMHGNQWVSILQLRIPDSLDFANLKCQLVLYTLLIIKTSWHVKFGKLRLLCKRLGSTIVNFTPPNGHTIDFASAKAIKKCIKLCVSYEMVAQQVIKCYTKAQNKSKQNRNGVHIIIKSLISLQSIGKFLSFRHQCCITSATGLSEWVWKTANFADVQYVIQYVFVIFELLRSLTKTDSVGCGTGLSRKSSARRKQFQLSAPQPSAAPQTSK